jgi:hypothetical protein
MPPAVMVAVMAMMMPVIIDQFDLWLAAIVRGIGRRGFQFVQDAARVGHAGNGVDRPNGRRDRGGAGKPQNAGKECSPIHRNLQFPRPSPAIMAKEAEWFLNGFCHGMVRVVGIPL